MRGATHRALIDRYANRRFGSALFILAIGLLAVAVVGYLAVVGAPWDTYTYLAAGERLNAGRDLYRAGAGDRAVPDFLLAAGSSAPLISPPLVAVLFRPFAALGDPIGVAAWWVLMAAGVAVALVVPARRNPLAAGVLAIALIVPLMWQMSMANVNALLLLAALASWWLVRGGRHIEAGFVIGLTLVLKVITLPLAAWCLATGALRAGRGLVAGVATASVVSILAAGMAAHFEYLDVLRTAAGGSGPFAPATLLGLSGPAATALPVAILVGGTIAVVALRARPALAYGIAIAATVLGFSAVGMHTYALLFALVAPFAWPMDASFSRRAGGGRSPATVR